MSGYGKLDIDNDLLCVLLIIEEKKLWRTNLYHQIILVELEHHMKRKSYQFNNTHLYNFIFNKKILSKIHTK